MADLPLLVNSTDAALLSRTAASPAVATSPSRDTVATEGFASVLGKRLMQGEGAVATESPPTATPVRHAAVAKTGEPRPVDGKPLPPMASQALTSEGETEAVVLDAALLSSIVPGNLAANGLPTPQLAGNTQSDTPNSTLNQPVTAQHPTRLPFLMGRIASQGAVPAPAALNPSATPALLDVAVNSQTAASIEQKMPAVAPNTILDSQRSSLPSSVAAMLGNPISASAQQALVRAGLNVGKASSLRADAQTIISSNVGSTQQSLPVASSGLSSLRGNTMHTQMFTAAMNAAVQASMNADAPAPVSHLNLLSSTTPTATTALPEGIVALSADTPRTVVNGFSPTLAVSTPVGQQAWANEVGQRVTWLANSELREAQLQLNPRSLGSVDVRISFGPEQQLNVSFVAANPVAREALDASLPRLREMLEQQGLNLADANISHESPEDRQQRNRMNDESSLSADAQTINHDVADLEALHEPASVWLGDGMLDAYA